MTGLGALPAWGTEVALPKRTFDGAQIDDAYRDGDQSQSARSSHSTSAGAMQSLFIIEDVFDITGRGCVLVPGIPYALGLDVKIGARLLVVSPDGAQTRTHIAGFEMIHNRRGPLEHAVFMVDRDVKKDQLKVGSTVYLLDGDGA